MTIARQWAPFRMTSLWGGEVAAVASADDAHGGFDLDAEDAAVVFDHQIVAGGVSPGLGDHEAVFGGASHETKLGPFATEFAVPDLRAGRGRRFGLGLQHLVVPDLCKRIGRMKKARPLRGRACIKSAYIQSSKLVWGNGTWVSGVYPVCFHGAGRDLVVLGY